MEAISLMQDWIKSVGSQAGLSEGNTNLLSGAVGASESRLEVKDAVGYQFRSPDRPRAETYSNYA